MKHDLLLLAPKAVRFRLCLLVLSSEKSYSVDFHRNRVATLAISLFAQSAKPQLHKTRARLHVDCVFPRHNEKLNKIVLLDRSAGLFDTNEKSALQRARMTGGGDVQCIGEVSSVETGSILETFLRGKAYKK